MRQERFMTVTELTMGQNVPLLLDGQEVETLRLTVEWMLGGSIDLDVSALLLDDSGRVRDDADFVFYNQPVGGDGSVRLLGKSQDDTTSFDRLLVSPTSVPGDITRIVVLVSSDSAGPGHLSEIAGLALSISTADEQQLCRFAVPQLSAETAVVVGELYQRELTWRFRAIGQGYDSGLAGVAGDYGITVETTDDSSEELPLTPDVSDPTPSVDLDPPEEQLALPLAPRTAARPVRTRKQTAQPAAVRPLTLGDDESWKAARLFPIVGIGGPDEQERRATSALLSVLMGVKEFGRAITSRLGAPAGLLETYLEVPFPLDERKVIPDGVLRIARGSRVWTALLEVKTGSNLLARPQVEDYLAVAKLGGYDAVITLSNELPATAGEHPVGIDRRKLRKVALHHLSWAEVVHEATMQLSHRGVADPTQAWVLSELVRYLQHPRSGASGFEDMGSAWVTVRDAVVSNTLRPGDKAGPEVAASWDRLIRQVCLRKTGELGTDVSPVGARAHAADPAARTAALVKVLVLDGTFTAGLRIPGTVGPMQITANLRTSQIELRVDVVGPIEGRPLTRVNWLLRQLTEAPGTLRIDALTARSVDARCELLSVARVNPKLLLPADGAPKGYRLSLSSPLGTKRGIGRGGFITSVQVAVDTFYRDVMEKLQPWSPPPPKLPAHDAAADEDQPEATDHPGGEHLT